MAQHSIQNVMFVTPGDESNNPLAVLYKMGYNTLWLGC